MSVFIVCVIPVSSASGEKRKRCAPPTKSQKFDNDEGREGTQRKAFTLFPFCTLRALRLTCPHPRHICGRSCHASTVAGAGCLQLRLSVPESLLHILRRLKGQLADSSRRKGRDSAG